MGMITLPKKKAAQPSTDILLSAFAAEIDRVGELTEQAEPILKEIEALQAKLKPLADAKKALAKKVDELEIGDDDEAVERGVSYKSRSARAASAGDQGPGARQGVPRHRDVHEGGDHHPQEPG